MSAPLVSFVTVTYKMEHFIRHLLQAIQDADLSFSYEFFVVDNGSQDGVANMVRERFPWVKMIALPNNIGLGPANNIAIQQATGKYIMHLNPDLVIFPGELDKWVQWMEKHPDVGVSGPRVFNPDHTDQTTCFRFPTLFTPVFRRTFLGRLPGIRQKMERYVMKGMDRTKEQDVDWVLGAAMCIQRDLLNKIGNFDERFFLYFEDADVCRRVWLAGKRVTYTPVASLIHYYGRTSRTKFALQALFNPVARIHMMSGVKYFLKYFRQPNPRHV